MKNRISDIMDELQDETVKLNEQNWISEERIKNLTMQKIRREERKKSYSLKWVATVAIIVGAVMIGTIGYANSKYPELFAKYFKNEDVELMKQMITLDPYTVENANYRMKVESMLTDTSVKEMKVSIEALNEESWQRLINKEVEINLWMPMSADATMWEIIGDGLQNEKKRYYLFECTAPKGVMVDLVLTSLENESEHIAHTDLESEQYGTCDTCLHIPIEFQGKSIKQSIVIKPRNVNVCEKIKFDQIAVNRLNICLSGTCSQESIADELRIEDLYEQKEALGIKEPEIIAELEDGKKVCLLLEPGKKTSMQVDETTVISKASMNNCISYEESQLTKTCLVNLDYKFEQMVDIEKIVKIWVNGIEYEIE